MADNQNTQNLIEDYLNNRLTEADRSQVDSMIDSDPQFKQELNFQKEVLDTLKEFRKVELKNRLGSLPVQSSLIGSLVSNSVYLKSALVAGLTGIVGIGAYFAFDNTSVDAITSKMVSIENVTKIDFPSTISPVAAPESIASIDVPVLKRNNFIAPNANRVKEIASKTTLKETSSPTITDLSIDINIDHDDDLFEEKSSDNVLSKDFENKAINKTAIQKNSEIEVAAINKGSKNFQYKFSKGKLYLYGDFGKETYEILEINRESEKEIILYLKGKYYELDNDTRKSTSLTPINDLNRIREIEILKKIKLDQ